MTDRDPTMELMALLLDDGALKQKLAELTKAKADTQQALDRAEIAKKDLAAAEAELSKWGERPLDGDYLNVQQRAGWARARLDAVVH